MLYDSNITRTVCTFKEVNANNTAGGKNVFWSCDKPIIVLLIKVLVVGIVAFYMSIAMEPRTNVSNEEDYSYSSSYSSVDNYSSYNLPSYNIDYSQYAFDPSDYYSSTYLPQYDFDAAVYNMDSNYELGIFNIDESTAVAFDTELEEQTLVYVDILEIVIYKGLYLFVPLVDSSEEFYGFVCEISLSDGEKIWGYMSKYDYEALGGDIPKTQEDLDAANYKLYSETPVRFIGYVRQADGVTDDLAEELGTDKVFHYVRLAR